MRDYWFVAVGAVVGAGNQVFAHALHQTMSRILLTALTCRLGLHYCIWMVAITRFVLQFIPLGRVERGLRYVDSGSMYHVAYRWVANFKGSRGVCKAFFSGGSRVSDLQRLEKVSNPF